MPASGFGPAHRKGRKERKAQLQCGTRMTRIGRIYTDPCASVSSVQSVFHHVCSSQKNPASGISAFITPKPCGFSDRNLRFSTPYPRMPRRAYVSAPSRGAALGCSTPRIRMPAGIRGHALQRRDYRRSHLRFFKNVIFQTGLTGLTGYLFNPVHPAILSNLKCQIPAPRLSVITREVRDG